MDWHIFTETERRTPAPAFRLPDSQGRTFAIDDNRGWGNVILFFAHHPDCPCCRETLNEFAARRLEYGADNAKPVVVLPSAPDVVATLDYPFPVLAGEHAAAWLRYAEMLGVHDAPGGAPTGEGKPPVMFFVIDRYGSACAGAALPDADAPELHTELLEWLDFIEMQCPE
jgi:peroxiredoxin